MSNAQTLNTTFDPTTFDDYPILYEELLAWPYRQELEFPTLKQLLGDISGLKILDYGCGPGVISRWLHQQGAGQVVGYDISTGMISYAKQVEEKSKFGITYVSALDETYHNYFDVIFAVYVMPYVTQPDDLLSMSQEMFKMLKKGGKLITLPLHPNFNTDPEYYRSFGFRLIEKGLREDGCQVQLNICKPPYDINIDAYYWSKETLENTLDQAGFQNLTWESLTVPANLSPELVPYAECPHVAIIKAVK